MFNRLPSGRLNYVIMANIGTIFFGQTSEYNGKRVCDMTDEEKAALVVRYKARGTTCIIDGYNNKEKDND